MNISIEDYVKKNYTQDMQDVLAKMFSLLERLNIDSYEGYFLDKFNNLEQQDNVFLDLDFVTYLEGFLFSLQKEFGFLLDDQLPFEQRIDFTQAYVDLEDFNDHDSIIRILETDLSDSEKLAECISLTYPALSASEKAKDVDNILAMIREIDESALLTLERLHISESSEKNLETDLESNPVSEDHITQIKAYELFCKQLNVEIKSLELVRSGYSIGLPFKVYWEKRKDDLFEQGRMMTELYHDYFSRELISLFLLSREYWTNPALAFNDLSESFFDDLKTIQQINTNIKLIMSRFLKFKAENRIK